jgi:hypothetical protein
MHDRSLAVIYMKIEKSMINWLVFHSLANTARELELLLIAGAARASSLE